MYTAIYILYYISISQYQYVEKVIEANSQKLLGRENIGRYIYIYIFFFGIFLKLKLIRGQFF